MIEDAELWAKVRAEMVSTIAIDLAKANGSEEPELFEVMANDYVANLEGAVSNMSIHCWAVATKQSYDIVRANRQWRQQPVIFVRIFDDLFSQATISEAIKNDPALGVHKSINGYATALAHKLAIMHSDKQEQWLSLAKEVARDSGKF